MSLTQEIEEPMGEVDGITAGWVTGLTLGHSTIYVGKEADRIHLFFENEQGQLVTRLMLSEADREEWLRLLSLDG